MDIFGPWRPLICKARDAGGAFLFEYQTPRVVTMRSRRIGTIYRIAQLALLVYLIGYVFVYNKSYQEVDTADSSVVTKIKGVLMRNTTTLGLNESEIWDSSDYVVPAQESDAYFITTNLLYTANQSQGVCPEDKNVGTRGVVCSSDTDCQKGVMTPYGNGIKTGRCVNRTGTCEIQGWCPTEVDNAPKIPELFGHDTVTILVKNHINFRKFDIKRRNILKNFTESYLQTCRFHRTKDPLCPIFGLRYIIKDAEEDLDDMAVKGGIIGFGIEWKCNFDRAVDECLPKYTFKRLDSVNDTVAKGWNFRTTVYYYDNDGKSRRDLIKYWGIRFVFLAHGQAGKFCIVMFLMHLGSSIGLFGIASIICEIILNYCRKSDILNDSKFVNLEVLKARRKSSLQLAIAGQTPLMSLLPSRRYFMRPSVVSNLEQPTTAGWASTNPNSALVTPAQDRKLVIPLNESTIFCDFPQDDGSQWV